MYPLIRFSSKFFKNSFLLLNKSNRQSLGRPLRRSHCCLAIVEKQSRLAAPRKVLVVRAVIAVQVLQVVGKRFRGREPVDVHEAVRRCHSSVVVWRCTHNDRQCAIPKLTKKIKNTNK